MTETVLFLKRAQMFTMKFDGFALESADGGKGAAMDPEEFEKKGLFVTIGDQLSRQIMGDGSGRLAQANGLGSTTATLVVDHPYYAKATKFLKKNKVIDIYDGASQEVNSIKIASVDSLVQVTLASTQTWSDDAWILDEDVFTTTELAGKGEMMGMMGIISDADPPYPNASAGLQGLLVASYPIWAANVFTNGGTLRPLGEDLLDQAFDADDVDVNVMLITKKIRRVWASILRNYKDFPTKAMWGGWVGIPYYYDGREIPMVPDNFVPDGHILGINEDDVTIHTTGKNGEPTWEAARDGSILQKVPLKNEFVAEGHIFSNVGISQRNTFFKIDDIQEPSK